MAKVSLLLVISQLSLINSHPAGNSHDQSDVRRRAITLSTDLEATTSYSTAIQTLQSATETSRPPAQGVLFKSYLGKHPKLTST
jgi:endo-1,3(4)-beta-glucanase